jgi:hypothetical protein
MWNRCVDGNGMRTSETRSLQLFDRIQVNGDFEVQVDTGRTSSAVVEVDENLLDLVVTHVSGNTLIIESRNNDCLRPTHPIEITVTTPAVSEITLNGSGYVNCYGLAAEELNLILQGSGMIDCFEVEATSVSVSLEGSGFINCSLYTENLTTHLEGSGEIGMSGASVNSDLKIIGSGRIKADRVNSNVCVAYISGSGRIDTRVESVLDITIIGSGMVYYSGNPTVESYISGSGKVVHQ